MMEHKSEHRNLQEGKIHPVEVRNLSVTYSTEPALWNVDLNFPEGKMIAVVGPNGAGKSTLIKAVMGLVPITAGKVSVYGKSYSKQRSKVAYVPQRGSVDWDFPTDALDVVEMGLYGKLGWLRRPNSQTREKARECLKNVGSRRIIQIDRLVNCLVVNNKEYLLRELWHKILKFILWMNP